MPTLASAKAKMLDRSGGGQRSRGITGVALTDSHFKGLKPISPCICVTEPCPCDRLEDVIIWLPTDTVQTPTGKKLEGDEVQTFDVDPDDEVLVEVQIPMTVSQLRQLKEWSSRQESQPSVNSVARGKKKKGVGVAAAALAAFEVGFALGTKIDEGTGLSDKISDWAAENIPWPW